ncbi:MAG: hypothetical protein ABMB14_05300 [Myxococcota bacterium]
MISPAFVACSDWPTFARDSDPTYEPFDDRIFVGLSIAESDAADSDFPDSPDRAVSAAPAIPLPGPFVATRISGTLSAFAGVGSGDGPFDCGETNGVSNAYVGDVDFVWITHDPGAVCILLSVDGVAVDPPFWDVIGYDLDPTCTACGTAPDCLRGPFLTTPELGNPNQPGSMQPGQQVNVLTTDSRDVALYVAAGSGSYAEPPQYDVYLVPTRIPSTCVGMTLDQIVELDGDAR